jgi:hypothetical protein
VNVLETLGVVSRQSKGAYAFCGWGALPTTLARIAAAGGEQAPSTQDASPQAPSPSEAALRASPEGAGAQPGGAPAHAPRSGGGGGSSDSDATFAAIQAAARAATAAAAAQPGGDSTLAGLTERFVRVFLTAKARLCVRVRIACATPAHAYACVLAADLMCLRACTTTTEQHGALG